MRLRQDRKNVQTTVEPDENDDRVGIEHESIVGERWVTGGRGPPQRQFKIAGKIGWAKNSDIAAAKKARNAPRILTQGKNSSLVSWKDSWESADAIGTEVSECGSDLLHRWAAQCVKTGHTTPLKQPKKKNTKK